MLDAVAVVCVVFVLHVLHDFPRTVSSCSLAFGIIPNCVNIALFSPFNTLQEAENSIVLGDTLGPTLTRDTLWQLSEERRSVAGAQASFLKR